MNTIIKRYEYGVPYNTEVAMVEIPKADDGPKGVSVTKEKETTLITINLRPKDQVLGLGQAVGSQNRRGRVYESWCTDEPWHTPEASSLYGAHPFFVITGEEPEAYWIDFPGRIHFDIGHTQGDLFQITIHGTGFNLYTIRQGTFPELVKTFRKLIGKPYIPPRWAFGHIQSRWGYKDKADIEAVIEGYQKNQLPLEAICLDIDYMERYKDFTIDKTAFPAAKKWVESVQKEGIQLVPIIDAGVKIEKDYPVYEEGIAQNYFVENLGGEPFTAAVWPGKCHFPDFLNPQARRWFGGWYKTLLDYGFEGFWNDMNEPALFYTEKGLDEALDLAEKSRGKNLDINSYFGLQHVFETLSNRQADYETMVHNTPWGKINHVLVHNLYGMSMTKAAAQGFETHCPHKRILMFSRASAIGAHRFGGIWTGDNHSWWEHLLLNVKMMPSLNYCGFLYTGADTGGFSGDTNPELLIRWYQFSLFTPLFRNHSALNTRAQEPFAFDTGTVGILRNALMLRNGLVPWLYSEYMKAVREDEPMFKPMQWEWAHDRAKDTEDQLLLGDALMLAPVVQPGVRGRLVWLPEPMALWKAKELGTQQWQVCPSGDHFIELELEETPIFLKKDKIFMLGKQPGLRTTQNSDVLQAIAFTNAYAEAVLYDDDGITSPPSNGSPSELHLTVKCRAEEYTVEARAIGPVKYKEIQWTLIDLEGKITYMNTPVVF